MTWTLNNPTEEEIEHIKNGPFKFIVFQQEVGAVAQASFRRHGAHDEFVPAPTGQWVRANPETKRQKQKRLHNRKMYLLRRSKDPRIREGQRRYALEELLREFPEHFT